MFETIPVLCPKCGTLGCDQAYRDPINGQIIVSSRCVCGYEPPIQYMAYPVKLERL